MDKINHVPTDLDFCNNCKNHQCSCCGNCCGEFIPITRKEIERIKEYMKSHPEIKNNWPSSDDKNLYAFCPFLNKETNRCDVYPVRPFVCRDFKCDRSKETIKAKREAYAKRADYNAFKNKEEPIVSWHYLFFDDYNFDLCYRHLICKKYLKKGNLTLEAEMKLIPMVVDKRIVFKEGE